MIYFLIIIIYYRVFKYSMLARNNTIDKISLYAWTQRRKSGQSIFFNNRRLIFISNHFHYILSISNHFLYNIHLQISYFFHEPYWILLLSINVSITTEFNQSFTFIAQYLLDISLVYKKHQNHYSLYHFELQNVFWFDLLVLLKFENLKKKKKKINILVSNRNMGASLWKNVPNHLVGDHSKCCHLQKSLLKFGKKGN